MQLSACWPLNGPASFQNFVSSGRFWAIREDNKAENEIVAKISQEA